MRHRRLFFACFLLTACLAAAEKKAPEPEEKKPVSFVRIWTLLKDAGTLDVKCEDAPNGVLFSALGPVDSRLYVKLPPGSHELSLVRSGGDETPVGPALELQTEPYAAYTLLAARSPDSGQIEWHVLQDHPIRGDEEGMHLYNFLGESEFRVRVGDGPDIAVPPNRKPIHISPAFVVGKVVIFSRVSKRGAVVETHIEPDDLAPGSRVNVIITRDSYNLPVVEVLRCADPREIGFGE